MIRAGVDPAGGESPKKGRLLIFDDDEDVGDALAMLAEDFGMETRVATRLQPFVQDLESWAPTHIALDLMMPEIDGVQAMRLLAERGCPSMIIISSGFGGKILEAARRSAEAYNLNIAGVLPKPFEPGVLQALLARQAPTPSRSRPSQAVGAGEITEAVVRQALERREIELAYQPKIACASGRVCGFEALARLRRPGGEVIMPDRFIPVIERCGLIGELTDQVCDLALHWLVGPRVDAHLSMSVNISNGNLRDSSLADRLATLCAELHIDPGRVTIELTETGAMEHIGDSVALLTRFRMKGFQLAIDDFGTGYSSMLRLIRLPFSEMKIDKTFVIDAARSEESRTVIKSMVDLGRGMDLLLAAEGVEDAATLKFLAEIGCDLAQGYHIAKPMPGDKVFDWMSSRQV